MLALAAPQDGERLLDVGTGTGLVLHAVRDAGVRPSSVLGVDPSAGMLAQVGPLPDGWRVEQRPGQRTGLADGSVDLVTCAYVLQVLEPDARVAVLAEARRVLRPGGRVVCATPWRPERAARVPFDLLARLPWLVGLRQHDPRPELTAAGFAVDADAQVGGRGYPTLVVRARR